MKILRITVNNIASLAGQHTVDFTQEPLRSAGLYSISGPTGAGKSTLLDALCLALYNATPRLQSAGRLEDMRQGDKVEKQNDTRSLLRRGAVDGFAEVAFIGVDQLAWTARWSVRRSRRKADGNVQDVEMVLFRGLIEPGENGPLESGGKKTQVLPDIASKIGLTFEQFTRAVLLAQNDFAAFLKADDKQRAEILQALTGTELFEAISKEVHRRHIDEKRIVEGLESRLQGNKPLTTDERTAAESTSQNATVYLTQTESQLKLLEAYIAWFQQKSKLESEWIEAEARWQQSVTQRDAAAGRRTELESTETISRDARSLRNHQQSDERAVVDHRSSLQKYLVELDRHRAVLLRLLCNESRSRKRSSNRKPNN